jgi:L-ascorbate metabolism protein UlaG (beta-lactamase superfamily)
MTSSPGRLGVRLAGGPTAVLELGGVRLLTDPTFDPPGRYPIGDRALVKTTAPAFGPEEVGPLDAVLLSHDQHPDNLDRAGREVLATAPRVLSTASAGQRLGDVVTVLPSWASAELPRPDGGTLTVTAVPAQHGPDGTEHLVGEVTGFVLSGDGLPTVYVSGDNASLAVVRAVAERCGPVELAVLFAGAARTPLVDGELTLGSPAAAEAVRLLGVRAVVPVHTEGWEHFTQGPDTVARAFADAGLADRLVLLAPGERAEL